MYMQCHAGETYCSVAHSAILRVLQLNPVHDSVSAVGHMQCNAGETAAVLVGNVSDSVSSPPSASAFPSASAQIERHSPVSYSCAVQTVQPVESVVQLPNAILRVLSTVHSCSVCADTGSPLVPAEADLH